MKISEYKGEYVMVDEEECVIEKEELENYLKDYGYDMDTPIYAVEPFIAKIDLLDVITDYFENLDFDIDYLYLSKKDEELKKIENSLDKFLNKNVHYYIKKDRIFW